MLAAKMSSAERALEAEDVRGEIAARADLGTRVSLRAVSRSWEATLAGRRYWPELAGSRRALVKKALTRSCSRGLTEAARWLTETFGVTADDVRAWDNGALRAACRGSHLATAAWLVERFGLTANDARADDGEALRCACALGRLGVARWLVSEFGLTADDVRAHDNQILRQACENGHLEVVQWLVEESGLTAKDGRAVCGRALWSGRPRSAAMEWLMRRFGLEGAPHSDV